MARQSSATKEPKNTQSAASSQWAALTWKDLDEWAGSRSVERGRRYQRNGVVKNLALADDGRLLATVIGTKKYTVTVATEAKSARGLKLQSTCTCPVGSDGCKHAVATVAEFLQLTANEKPIPAADPNDQRWAKLSADYDPEADEEEEDLDRASDDSCASNWPQVARHPTKQKSRTGPQKGTRTRAKWDEQIRSQIDSKSRPELALLVWSFVERFPELRAEFQERIALAEGDVQRLVADTKKEMRKVTAELGWQNHWDGGGHTPSYDRLKHRLERLLELGHADELVALGPELIERGMAQVGQSHDEGETAMELSGCLEVVFQAIVKSSLAASDQILFAINACLQDGYDVLGESLGDILDAEYASDVWSCVADRLSKRLQKTTIRQDERSFSVKYHRDQLSNWLLTALENAGRGSEASAIYEAEARATGSYERLVKYLIEQQRIEEAEQWAREGIEQTLAKLPGIASSLRRMLCDVARCQKQWDVVAAHAAAAFFEQPSLHGFKELMAAAEEAKCGEHVRAAALQFLETGKKPVLYVTRKGQTETVVDPNWILPVLDYLMPAPRTGSAPQSVPVPHLNVLLEMALAAKRPDDALKWFDKMAASQKGTGVRWSSWHGYGVRSLGEQVAAAVAASRPERALEIYQRGLASRLPEAHFAAYEACAEYLKKMRPIFSAIHRAEDWQKLVAGVRQKYANRPRFMEILDKLEGRTIRQTQKSPRGGLARR
ncbi:MAG TPA: SWIM zinc finger family protein [Pirellulaceae bacterium]|jgi:uncharacterized Zn finger protein